MTEETPRPAEICRQLREAMGASEGRRARRKRDTTPDALGMGIKRSLLEAAVAADPDPEAFEAWLFGQIADAGQFSGSTRAMARQILDEWHFALASGGFRQWLASGAPSDDAASGSSSSESGDQRRRA